MAANLRREGAAPRDMKAMSVPGVCVDPPSSLSWQMSSREGSRHADMDRGVAGTHPAVTRLRSLAPLVRVAGRIGKVKNVMDHGARGRPRVNCRYPLVLRKPGWHGIYRLLGTAVMWAFRCNDLQATSGHHPTDRASERRGNGAGAGPRPDRARRWQS